MNNVEVTIYCRTYNHEKYIRDALNGFVMQKTSFNFEVLVYDDASTDNTANIIREYEIKYPEIIKPIYQKENQYRIHGDVLYKYLLPRTKGKYIALCEGDDYWIDEYKLQKQFDYMEEHSECSVVVHKALTLLVRENVFVQYCKYDFNSLTNYDLTASEVINDRSLFPTASMFFKTDFYIENEKFIKSIVMYDYAIKILLAMEGKVHIIPEVMSVYRKGAENSWTKRIGENNKKFAEFIRYGIYVLNRINDYTKYKFDDDIKKSIERMDFNIQKVLLNIKTLKKEPYVKMYREMSLQSKLLLYIKKYLPLFYAFLKWICHCYYIFLNKYNRKMK